MDYKKSKQNVLVKAHEKQNKERSFLAHRPQGRGSLVVTVGVSLPAHYSEGRSPHLSLM